MRWLEHPGSGCSQSIVWSPASFRIKYSHCLTMLRIPSTASESGVAPATSRSGSLDTRARRPRTERGSIRGTEILVTDLDGGSWHNERVNKHIDLRHGRIGGYHSNRDRRTVVHSRSDWMTSGHLGKSKDNLVWLRYL